MARLHENRFDLEHQFVHPGAGDNLQLLFMQMQGKFEKFAGIDLDMHLWFINTAPWSIDFFLISFPLNIDATEMVATASEADAINKLNDQIDKDEIEKQAALALQPFGYEDNRQYDYPNDGGFDSADIRTEFDRVLPFKIHAQLKTIVPVLNAGFDGAGTQNFGRKHIRWDQRFDYSYKKPSVLCMFARQLQTTIDLTGPWDAAGLCAMSEKEVRYLYRPASRAADDQDLTTGIRVKIPWVIPQTSAFEGSIGPILNCVSKISLYTMTNHPLAETAL